MSIGERLKAARHAAAMSQRALAETAGVSATAISKYERGLDIPSSQVLIRLAQALGVQVAHFLRPRTVTLSAPVYRRRASLPRKQEQAVLARVEEWLERYLDIETLFGEAPHFEIPADLNRGVHSLEEVERVALALRHAWQLGLDPIESLVDMLEEHGIKVGMADAHDDFDALTVWANHDIPVIVVRRGLPGDRQRFNLAHEMGHLILQPDGGVDAEKAAYRFAGAFLVPEPVARAELGERRHRLGLYELHLLKHKYGLSMQAWVYRARDLGILSQSAAGRLFREFRKHGWHRQEPGDPLPPEESGRMKRLVMRALAEDVISESRAAELLGEPLDRFWREEMKRYYEFPVGVRG